MLSVSTHRVPLRWSDLDALNHINNVTFIELGAEARAELPGWDRNARIRQSTVQFLRPIQLTPEPAVITSRVEGETVIQEIRIGDEELVYGTLHSTTAAAEPAEPFEAPYSFDFSLRHRDVADGAVDLTRLFELFQESRVRCISEFLGTTRTEAVVVARTTVNEVEPISWRREPLELRIGITRLGNSSYTIATHIVVDGSVAAHASSVMVNFDATTQTSLPLTEHDRESLSAGLIAS